jgi:hypothetical protein
MEMTRNFVVLCVCACGIVVRLTEQSLLPEYGVHLLSASTSDTSASYAHAVEGHFI